MRVEGCDAACAVALVPALQGAGGYPGLSGEGASGIWSSTCSRRTRHRSAASSHYTAVLWLASRASRKSAILNRGTHELVRASKSFIFEAVTSTRADGLLRQSRDAERCPGLAGPPKRHHSGADEPRPG